MGDRNLRYCMVDSFLQAKMRAANQQSYRRRYHWPLMGIYVPTAWIPLADENGTWSIMYSAAQSQPHLTATSGAQPISPWNLSGAMPITHLSPRSCANAGRTATARKHASSPLASAWQETSMPAIASSPCAF